MTENRTIPALPPPRSSAAGQGAGSRARRLFAAVLCLVSCLLWLPSAARADGIEARRAEVQFADGNYFFSVDFDVRFNFVVQQALEQGVPLYFVSEFTLTHPRWYWLDEVIVQSAQTVKLSYNTLARQYRITRGALYQNFSSLDEALRVIAHPAAVPVAARLLQGEKLFGRSDSYVAAMRLRLDVSQLPKPLQVNALAGNDWSLDSDWYRWIARPGDVSRDKGD